MEIKGIPALIILLVIVGICVFSMKNTQASLERDTVIRVIDPWVKASYTKNFIPEIKQAMEKNDLEKLEHSANTLLKIRYKSLTVKGVFQPFVVKVESEVNGQTDLKYFCIRYDRLLGSWQCGSNDGIYREVSSLKYKTKFHTRAKWDL